MARTTTALTAVATPTAKVLNHITLIAYSYHHRHSPHYPHYPHLSPEEVEEDLGDQKSGRHDYQPSRPRTSHAQPSSALTITPPTRRFVARTVRTRHVRRDAFVGMAKLTSYARWTVDLIILVFSRARLISMLVGSVVEGLEQRVPRQIKINT
jgi:hypothetical protein